MIVTTDRKIKSIKDAVIAVIDNYPIGYRFYGHRLHSDVIRIYPAAENAYVDTVLRKARQYRRSSFRAVNQKSLYEKIAG
ncbi:MAG: hypothetical protein FWD87_06340 [Spirochaetaceae bacterium]|nr:hypothetical protein [Spirochaetaceae bacterium]